MPAVGDWAQGILRVIDDALAAGRTTVNASTLFRGTSEGWPGSPGTQQVGVTPASTDPIVATCFGTQCSPLRAFKFVGISFMLGVKTSKRVPVNIVPWTALDANRLSTNAIARDDDEAVPIPKLFVSIRVSMVIAGNVGLEMSHVLRWMPAVRCLRSAFYLV